MNKRNYDKVPLSFSDQLELVKSRGLTVPNDKKALSYLQEISYYRLSAYFLPYQSRIHINDKDFALDDGLLPKKLALGKMKHQFSILAENAGIDKKTFANTLSSMTTHTDRVEKMIFSSFLNDTTKRNYLQSYKTRLKQLMKE